MRGFRLLPGTRLPGNNGIETSLDDREFYVIAFGWHAVVVYARDDTSQPLRKVTAPGFMPDNIHWDGSRLILAGMQYDEPACGGTRKIIDGKADDMRCHRGYTVAALEPQNTAVHDPRVFGAERRLQRRFGCALRGRRVVAGRVPGRADRGARRPGHSEPPVSALATRRRDGISYAHTSSYITTDHVDRGR